MISMLNFYDIIKLLIRFFFFISYFISVIEKPSTVTFELVVKGTRNQFKKKKKRSVHFNN